jgi:hypothetical protein
MIASLPADYKGVPLRHINFVCTVTQSTFSAAMNAPCMSASFPPTTPGMSTGLWTVGQDHLVDDRRRGGDEVEVELELQPLLDDFEMQQPRKPQRSRTFPHVPGGPQPRGSNALAIDRVGRQHTQARVDAGQFAFLSVDQQDEAGIVQPRF